MAGQINKKMIVILYLNSLSHIQVLFPLLDNVKKLSGQASDVKVDTSGSMLIHHSRNTAQKQWAETQVRILVFVFFVFSAANS